MAPPSKQIYQLCRPGFEGISGDFIRGKSVVGKNMRSRGRVIK
jgi:hypothetical protein